VLPAEFLRRSGYHIRVQICQKIAAMQKPFPKPQPERPEDLLQQEALAVARSLQRPGQTKEQTKLIAQGIAKGIEQYKRQQSAKARERDKAQKRFKKQKANESAAREDFSGDASAFAEEPSAAGQRAPLLVGGALFGVFALAHVARLLGGWTLILGGWNLPPGLSLAAAVILGALSAWFFRSALAIHPR
jgi:hypothetical protein